MHEVSDPIYMLDKCGEKRNLLANILATDFFYYL